LDGDLTDSSGTPPGSLASTGVPGIDRRRVAEWLADGVDGLRAPFDFELVSGGRSNLTFKVRDAGGRIFVLRRPPLGNRLPSAHDMGREYRVLEALHGGTVPVPQPLGFCADKDVNGASFYAMDFVDGWILRTPELTEEAFPEESQRGELGESVISVLADLHSLDPEAVGLGDLGRPSGYIERQLKRWYRQWNDSKTRELPAIDAVYERLIEAVPEQQRVSIVHGDYRLDNVVVARQPRVAAVLDWELCTLGDPLADLGGLIISWIEAGEPGAHALAGVPTALPGFPSRAALIAAYGEMSGLDVSGIDYYLAFSYWKLACIGEGVYARYRAGAMGAEPDVSLADLVEKIDNLSERAVASIL
jgi:aminoglycoside phosphotransferase (APT) family kinase protein